MRILRHYCKEKKNRNPQYIFTHKIYLKILSINYTDNNNEKLLAIIIYIYIYNFFM